MRSSEGGLTSFNNNNRANFPVKKSATKLSGKSIFWRFLEKIKLNFVLVVVRILAFSINGCQFREIALTQSQRLCLQTETNVLFLPTEIPVFPTLTARVTFQDFKSCDNIPSSMFFIPRDYKVSRLDSLIGKNQINNHFTYLRNRHHVTVFLCPFDFLF